MYKRGCWDEEKEEKWMKESQKLVGFHFFLLIYFKHVRLSR